MTIVSLFYAPLTEEPAKWLTARGAHRFGAQSRTIRSSLALAAGAGFGVGEIWFLAHALINSPSYPELPFWMFGGFMLERLEVCFLHGVLLIPPFYALANGRSFLLGGLVGMVMHFLLNFPIFLAQIDAFGLGEGWLTAAPDLDDSVSLRSAWFCPVIWRGSMRPRKRREDGILCALPVAEDGGPTIQYRRLCREDLADRSECHARLCHRCPPPRNHASGAVGSAPCADGGAAASAGADAGQREAFIRGSGADGNASLDRRRAS